MANTFVILGIHGKEVTSVNEYEDVVAEDGSTSSILVKENNVARVRMFINGKEFDEDFDLPELPDAFPQTQEVYTYLLKKKIDTRMNKLSEENK